MSVFILLLPSTPSPPSFSTIDAAYRPALEQFLAKETSRLGDGQMSYRIDIALAVPFSAKSKKRLFPEAQALLAAIYRSVCIAATKCSVDLDLPGGVDARVFLIGGPNSEKDECSIESPQKLFHIGPIIDMRTLAEKSLTYGSIFSLDSKQGEGMLQQLLSQMALNNVRIPFLERLHGSVKSYSAKSETPASDQKTESQVAHSSVAVGGTFDHLHVGHKLLLTATALGFQASKGLSSKLCLTVGITGDQLLVNKKHAAYLEDWDARQRRVAEFLEYVMIFPSITQADRKEEHVNEAGPNGRRVIVKLGSKIEIHYVQISDPFGPTITDESISALVVSKETSAGGEAVNQKRQEQGWSPLEIFEVDVLHGNDSDKDTPSETLDDFRTKISSTAIRSRLHNTTG